MTRWLRIVADWPFWHNLRLRLVLLVLLALLPSLALLYLTARQERVDAVETGRDEATRIARLVASDQQTVTSQIATVLGTLAINPDLQGTDAGACSALLAGVLDSGAQPSEGAPLANDVRVNGASIQQLAVISADGTVFCRGARTASAVATPEAGIVDAALERNRFVSGIQGQNQAGIVQAAYAVPIPVGPTAQGRVLVAMAEITALDMFAATAKVPSGTFIIVADRAGTALQQYPAESSPLAGLSLVGTPVSDDVSRLQGRSTQLAEDLLDGDGRAYIWAIDTTWSPGTDEATRVNYVLVGIPEASVVRQADEKFNENLGRLGIAGLVGIVAAWVGSDLIGTRDAGTRMGLVRDYYHLFETGQVDRLDQFISPDYIDRSASPGAPAGLEGLRQNIAAFRSAFPDGRIRVHDVMADHDAVMARVSLTGTQVAPYAGIPPANEPVIADGVETFRFAHGMVVESWSLFGALRERDPRLAVPEPAPEDTAARPGFLRRAWRRVTWGGVP